MPALLWLAVLVLGSAVAAYVLGHHCLGFNCNWRLLRHRAKVRRADTREDVTGAVVHGIDGSVLKEVDGWRTWLTQNNQGDKDWDWRLFLQEAGLNAFLGWEYEAFTLKLDGKVGALMLLRTRGWHSRFPEDSSRIVYVEYLAAAPDARIHSSPRKYRYCGEAMLQFALHRSRNLGARGRIGLHSLPGAEEFYRRAGLHDFGPDLKEQGFRYFEMPGDRV